MSAASVAPAGLGIDLSSSLPLSAPKAPSCSNALTSQNHSSSRTLDNSDGTSGAKNPPSASGATGHATLRSMSAMRGLLLAEVGESMVEFDLGGGGSGFREGQRIAPEAVTPGGGSHPPNPPPTSCASAEQISLARHGTLVSVGAAPGRNAAELKSLLGNSDLRLRPGASILPQPGQTSSKTANITSLEQAKPRARVEVDIVLQSNTCVEGGYLKGHIKVHVRKYSKKESTVLIAGGKVRIIGFECIPSEDDRHTFYQCSAPLSEVTTFSESIYASLPDEEGFAQAREGLHILPFAMLLPLEGNIGTPKGALHVHSGARVRYIAMISIKVKDADTDKRSIAHFYRDCEVWPRLNPSIILAAAPRPLRATTSKTLFMGGSGKVNLTATLHRLHWIAGQQCYVRVSVANDTKKTVKSLTLSLIRSIIIFKPHPQLDALPATNDADADPDACQTSTTQKQIAETTLEMGQRGAKGHASAKGWWTGVSPGEQLDFSHFLLLPPDALSITRTRLLEVEYTIRVSLSAGSLASDIRVTLPIRIINFLSVDPPPSSPLDSRDDFARNSVYGSANNHDPEISGHQYQHTRPTIAGVFDPLNTNSRALESLTESEDESPLFSDQDSAGHLPYDELSQSPDSQLDVDLHHGQQADHQDTSLLHQDLDSPSTDAELWNLTMYDDSDEVVQHAINSARMDADYGENVTRFADLYYVSVQEGLDHPDTGPDTSPVAATADHLDEREAISQSRAGLDPSILRSNSTSIESSQTLGSNSNSDLPNGGSYGPRPSRPKGPSSFASRVREKLQAVTEHDDSGLALVVDRPLSLEDTEPKPEGQPCAKTIVDLDDHSSPSRQAKGDYYPCDSPLLSSGEQGIQTPSSTTIPAPPPPTLGSRLLPKPPSTSTLPVEEPGVEASAAQILIPSQTELKPRVAAVIHGAPPDDAAKTHTNMPRPPIAAASCGGSASSVKAKIRELEERMRAEQGVESSGPL